MTEQEGKELVDAIENIVKDAQEAARQGIPYVMEIYSINELKALAMKHGRFGTTNKTSVSEELLWAKPKPQVDLSSHYATHQWNRMPVAAHGGELLPVQNTPDLEIIEGGNSDDGDGSDGDSDEPQYKEKPTLQLI